MSDYTPLDVLKFANAECGHLLETAVHRLAHLDLEHAHAGLQIDVVLEMLLRAKSLMLEATKAFCPVSEVNLYSDGRTIEEKIEIEPRHFVVYRRHPKPDCPLESMTALCLVEDRQEDGA
jgi:hypothetical protein